MAKHLTDKQKKKIIKDYVESENYSEVARKNKVSKTTVMRIVGTDKDTFEQCKQKRKENTKDVLQYMDEEKYKVCKIIDLILDELINPEKIQNAGLKELATTMAIVIDKFTANEIQKSQVDDKSINITISPATKADI